MASSVQQFYIPIKCSIAFLFIAILASFYDYYYLPYSTICYYIIVIVVIIVEMHVNIHCILNCCCRCVVFFVKPKCIYTMPILCLMNATISFSHFEYDYYGRGGSLEHSKYIHYSVSAYYFSISHRINKLFFIYFNINAANNLDPMAPSLYLYLFECLFGIKIKIKLIYLRI